jgi:hypothetical protein
MSSELGQKIQEVGSVRVIRHESGWGIELDMLFADRQTAETIAKRIRHAVYALVRGAVDESMRRETPRTVSDEREGAPSGRLPAKCDCGR